MKNRILIISVIIGICTDLYAAEIIGRVLSVDRAKNEIIVAARNAASKVRLGDRLQVRTDKSIITLKAVFPMMTVVKCSAMKRGEIALVGKGMPVYTCCIEGGAAVMKKKKFNESMNRSLYVAVTNKNSDEVKKYLAGGADPNTGECRKDDFTFFISACPPSLVNAAFNDSNSIMKTLVDAGADLNAKDHEGRTALFVCIVRNNMDGVTMLLDAGANMEIRHNNGWTPLQTAVFSNKISIVKLLISRNVDVNTVDVNGVSSLHWAADWGYLDSMKDLIAAGAEVNKRDKYGKTPLMWAVGGHNDSNRAEVVRLLLDAGADRRLKDGSGNDAIWHAKGNSSIEMLLRSK